MLLAHISDLHLFASEAESSLVRYDSAQAALSVLLDIRKHTPKFDAILLTGDIADGGNSADYELALSILDQAEVPVFVIPGNHDTISEFRRAFCRQIPFRDQTALDYVVQFGAVRIIGLNSVKEGHVEGELTDEQLDWLEGQLSEPFSGPTYLLIHHPPCFIGIDAWDEMSLKEGRGRFQKIVREFSDGLQILSGHIHRPYNINFDGIPIWIGGSPAFQIGLDFTPGAPDPGPAAEPFSYFIHSVQGSIVTVHRRFVELPEKDTRNV